MANYLIIDSRDPFGAADTLFNRQLAADLAAAGHGVALFLVQNGVLAARPCAVSQSLSDLAGQGVEILADEFSLRQRGIPDDGLIDGVKAAPLDVVIDRMCDGHKTIWQ